MSTKSEVDLFKNIKIPEESFWDTILNKDTQKSSSLNGKSPLKKETIPAINEEDEEITIVKEVPASFGTIADLRNHIHTKIGPSSFRKSLGQICGQRSKEVHMV